MFPNSNCLSEKPQKKTHYRHYTSIVFFVIQNLSMVNTQEGWKGEFQFQVLLAGCTGAMPIINIIMVLILKLYVQGFKENINCVFWNQTNLTLISTNYIFYKCIRNIYFKIVCTICSSSLVCSMRKDPKCLTFLLGDDGVIAPVSTHTRHSGQSPIKTSGISSPHVYDLRKEDGAPQVSSNLIFLVLVIVPCKISVP